eukprot:5388996-Pleurochrysis_carterae.AAC.1
MRTYACAALTHAHLRRRPLHHTLVQHIGLQSISWPSNKPIPSQPRALATSLRPRVFAPACSRPHPIALALSRLYAPTSSFPRTILP